MATTTSIYRVNGGRITMLSCDSFPYFKFPVENGRVPQDQFDIVALHAYRRCASVRELIDDAIGFRILFSNKPQESMAWNNLMHRKNLPVDTHCCRKQCFELPDDPVFCPMCKAVTCICKCDSYRNRIEQREKQARKRAIHEQDSLHKERAALLRQLERNKTKAKKLRRFEAQIGSVFDIPGNINSTLLSTTSLMDTLKGCVDNIIGKVDHFLNLFGLPKDFDLIGFCLTSLSFVQSLFNFNKIGLFIGAVALARYLKFDYSRWLNLAKDLIIGRQDGTEFMAQAFELPTSCLLTTIGGFLISLTSMMLSGTSMDFKNCLKHLGEFGRAAVGWTKITDLLTWFKNFFLDCYYRYTLGKTLEQVNMEKKYPELEVCLLRASLLTGNEFQNSYLDRDVDLCKKVIELDETLNEILKAAIRARDNDTANLVRAEMLRLRNVFTSARSSAAHAHKTRAAPSTLYVYGESGVGKSNLVNYIKFAIYKKKYENDPNWTPNNMTHTRCAENEFWDGLLPGQPVVQYDDIFQAKDTQANPNPEIMEIIRACNEAPYHLHMASVEEKKDCYFTARYIIATSNVKTPRPVSIAQPAALLRRWDIAIDVGINANYGKMDPTNTYLMIDQTKVDTFVKAGAPAFIKEVYTIDVYDISSGDVIQRDMTLDQFMDYFWKKTDSKLEQGQKLIEAIAASFDTDPPCTDLGFSSFAQKFVSSGFKAQMDDDDDLFSDAPTEPDEYQIRLERTSMDDQLADLFKGDLRNQIAEMEREILENEPPVDDLSPMGRLRTCYFRFRTSSIYKKFLSCKARFNQRFSLASVKTSALGYCRTLAHSLAIFFKSDTFPLLVAGLSVICAMYVSGNFLSLGCKRTKITNLIQMKMSECNCSSCKEYTFKFDHGTDAYAFELLKQLNKTTCGRYPEWKSWMYTLRKEYLDAMIIHRLKELSEFTDKVSSTGFLPESREINTRFAPSRRFAESREVRTRFASTNHRAESRELQTRGYGLRPRSEMALPMYSDETGDLRFKAQISDVNQLEQWESVVYTNMVTLRTTRDQKVNGVFVKGRILLTVYHFVQTAMEGDGKIIIVAPNNRTGNVVLLSSCNVRQLTDVQGNVMDLCFLAIPNQPSRKDIVSKFHDASSMARINQGSFVVGGLRDVRDTMSLFTFHGSKMNELSGITYDFRDEVKVISQAVEYDVDTQPGDCGSLIYAKNSFFSGKIIGMHVAGKDGVGLGAVISKEFLTRNLERFARMVPDRMMVNGRLPYSAELSQPTLKQAIPDSSLSKLGNCLTLGMLPSVFAPSKTQLRNSLVVGTLKEPDTKPAFLKPITLPTGEEVDPMIKGVAKVMTATEPLEPEILEVCTIDVFDKHFSNTADKRIYSFEEAISGIEGEDYVTPLNRTSSAGYPWVFDTKEPGKRKWLGYDDYEYSSEVREEVEKLIDNCKNNTRGDVVWMACLKDERRPIAKVDQGKTRVFTGGPMHYTIAFRMYFLAFIRHVMENRITNEIGVGTNVYNCDWHRTGLALSKMGNKVIAGDFSNFDGSLLQDALWSILDLINEWYDDGEENARVRSVLFEEICNARVLVKGELIQWDHSQPSGNPATVIINSLFNQIIMRYAYLLCKYEHGLPLILDFTKYVSMQTFGDDNVLNIHNDVIDWFNQETITRNLADIGLTYTDEGKTGVIVPYRSLDEISYLKRSFKRDENGYFRAPLEIGVVEEMTNWIRGQKGNGKPETYENCEAAIRESFYHGKEKFSEHRNKLTEALRSQGIAQRLPTFSELRSADSHAFF